MFAVAGVIAAAVPVALHLLNRQRFRTVHWAPMEFLRLAMVRSRKMLQMRDVLLMVVRTAALLMLGFALSRPFFSAGYGTLSALALVCGFFGILSLVAAAVITKTLHRVLSAVAGALLVAVAVVAFLGDFAGRSKSGASAVASRQAVHVILLIDNSLSMGYRQTSGTLLDDAKIRAKEIIDDLPGGSRVTVVPLCGSSKPVMLDPCVSVDDARSAVGEIRLVDRAVTMQQAATLAAEASRYVTDLDKRIVLLSDHQRRNWTGDSQSAWKQVNDLQIVDLAPQGPRENAWVADVQLQDQVAAKDAPAVITATIGYDGAQVRHGVEVALKVRDKVVDTRSVDLAPGQGQPVVFTHKIESSVKGGETEFVPVSVSIGPPDRLPHDDVRYAVVPVVAGLPVLFVDQYGDREDIDANLFGETLQLRMLLTPRLSRQDQSLPIIDVRHITMERLAQQGQAALEDARLVVIAGSADPGPMVKILRQYVEQGGQLFIAAGGEFQPAAWNLSAWLDGAGILPAQLADEPVGKTLRESGEAPGYFQWNFDSLIGDYFHIPSASTETLRDLYAGAAGPYFFKAVVAKVESADLDKAIAAQAKRTAENLKFLIETDSWANEDRAGGLTDKQRADRLRDKQRRSDIQPRWLTWARQRVGDPMDRRPAAGQSVEQLAKDLADKTRPRVLARYGNGVPSLVQRSVGLGNIVMFTSGTLGSWDGGWNTVGLDDAVIVYDRILRSMLHKSLPQRVSDVGTPLVLPIDKADRLDSFALKRPDGLKDDLPVEVLEGDTYALTVRTITQRGEYHIQRTAGRDAGKKPFEADVAFNGLAGESQVTLLTREQIEKTLGEVKFKWIAKGDSISLQGSRARGESLWKWLIWSVLLLMLLERLIVIWPNLRAKPQQEAAHG
ncbi:MAG: BatA domain-containing protein [Phycisphaerae bacterium]